MLLYQPLIVITLLPHIFDNINQMIMNWTSDFNKPANYNNNCVISRKDECVMLQYHPLNVITLKPRDFEYISLMIMNTCEI